MQAIYNDLKIINYDAYAKLIIYNYLGCYTVTQYHDTDHDHDKLQKFQNIYGIIYILNTQNLRRK